MVTVASIFLYGICTKIKIQAGVFGAGYPSIPTMMLDELYPCDNHVMPM